MRTINQAGIDLIKSFEGIRDGDKLTPNFDAYLCPANYWTIGYGHVVKVSGVMLKGAENESKARIAYPRGLTLAECESLLTEDLNYYCSAVEKLVKVKITDNQFAALVSLAYNIGVSARPGVDSAFSGSTLLDMLNKGYYETAAAQFLVWNKATVNGKKVVLNGLTRRRHAERKLFLTV